MQKSEIIIRRLDVTTVTMIYRQFYNGNDVLESVDHVKCNIGTPLYLEYSSADSVIIDGEYDRVASIQLLTADLNKLQMVSDLTLKHCVIIGSDIPLFDGMERLSTLSIKYCLVRDYPILAAISMINTLKNVTLCSINSWYDYSDPDRLDLRNCEGLTHLTVEEVSMKHFPLLPKSIKKCIINQYNTYTRITGGLNMVKWSDYSELQYLQIVHTNIRGTIPKSISDAVSLKYLDLSRNQLRGPIPKTVSKLSALQCLNLSSNYLTGNPTIISDSLEYLALDGNLFDDIDIVSILNNCPNLRHISVVRSMHTGTIDLTTIQSLSVPMITLYTSTSTQVLYDQSRFSRTRTEILGTIAAFLHNCRYNAMYTLTEW